MPATARRPPHARTRVAPRHPRRVSGPIARPIPVPAPPRRGSTGVFERLRALPEHRLLDRLLRGRVWIWLIGILLGGIVAMQVSLLELNAAISARVEQAGALERVNADLETEVARLSSGERIQAVAAEEGMVAPPAGDVEFVRARPQTDPRLATYRMRPPSSDAREVMANGGKALAPIVPLVPVAPVVPEVVAPVVPEAVVAEPVVPAPTVAPEPVVPAPTVAPTG